MALNIPPGNEPEWKARLQEYVQRQKALQKPTPNPPPNSKPEWNGIKLPSPAAGEKLREESHDRLVKAVAQQNGGPVSHSPSIPIKERPSETTVPGEQVPGMPQDSSPTFARRQ